MFQQEIYLQKELPWNKEFDEDIEKAKKAILDILKEQKVSLSKTRFLFRYILEEIEDNNPITL